MIQPAESSRKTVDKAFRVLHAFSEQEPELSVGELSVRLHLHKSVVSRLVSALRDWRMLEKDPKTQKLRIGEGAFRIGSLYSARNNLVALAKPHLERLVARTEQSCHVSVLDGHQMAVVATVESPKALRVIMRLGERRSLHSTAAGKLFLALAEGVGDAVLAAPLDAHTPQTLTDPARLRSVLRRVAQERVGWNRGENSAGAGAVAAPIFDRAGHMIAALSTVYPLNVVDAARRDMIAEATAAAARAISQELGHSS